MADEQHEIRHIRWNEVFSFTQVFKSFRLAIHPSKLLLALAAIIVIFLGGWVLDRAWSLARVNVMEGEITAFTQVPAVEFREGIKAWKDSRPAQAESLWRTWEREQVNLARFRRSFGGALGAAFDEALASQGREPREPQTDKKEWAGLLSDAREAFKDMKDRAEDLLGRAEKDARAAAKSLTGDERREALAEIGDNVVLARQAMTKMTIEFEQADRRIRGRPVFASVLDFEAGCVHQALVAAKSGNIAGGLGEYGKAQAVPEDAGFLFHVLMGLHGVLWLICAHWLYAIIFLLFALAVWALFGGAICRIAALHAARDEKISVAQALRFSAGKFLSFFMAPLVPLFVIALVGGLIILGALVGNIPAVGSLIVGLLFFLAILGGLAIAFLLFGLVGGCPLMYPTIAVEGSDSFDAISRSYSYIFNRPWRAGLYSLVAVVYGSLCYVFVRLFAFVALKATHVAVKTGVWTGGHKLEGAADKIDVLWTAPTFGDLHGGINTAAMGWHEMPGAWLIWLWVYLIIGLVIAFLISYLCSAATVIYYLLRRQVDATDLDEVYIAEAHEEQIEAAPAEESAAGEEAEGDEAPPDEEKSD